jgi:predicted HicB family RNase H-like nuclease
MKNLLEHKGYNGSVEFSSEDNVFYGKIVGIRDVITFEGKTVTEIKESFKIVVDDYLQTCKELGKDPDKKYSGSFNVRLKPKLHKLASIRSSAMKISLNKFIEKAVEKAVDENENE